MEEEPREAAKPAAKDFEHLSGSWADIEDSDQELMGADDTQPVPASVRQPAQPPSSAKPGPADSPDLVWIGSLKTRHDEAWLRALFSDRRLPLRRVVELDRGYAICELE
eukprot:RCo005566